MRPEVPGAPAPPAPRPHQHRGPAHSAPGSGPGGPATATTSQAVLPATRARTAAVVADFLPYDPGSLTRANFDERWAAGLVQFKGTDRTPELKALLQHVLLEGRQCRTRPSFVDWTRFE